MIDLAGLFRLNRRRKVEDNIGKTRINDEEMNLIIYTDKRQDNLSDYFENKGLKVDQIYSSLEEAKSAFLMSRRRVRLVVIDTGTGVLSSSRMQEELENCLQYTDGVDKMFSVFLTKKTYFERNYLVQYHPYRGMEDALKKIIAYEENYGLLHRTQRRYDAESDIKFIGDRPPKENLKGVDRERHLDFVALTQKEELYNYDDKTLESTVPEGVYLAPTYEVNF